MNMSDVIRAPANCELHTIIHFLLAERHNKADILVKWIIFMITILWATGVSTNKCRKFKEVQTDVHDKDGHRRESVAI